jgi:hypothetical protein
VHFVTLLLKESQNSNKKAIRVSEWKNDFIATASEPAKPPQPWKIALEVVGTHIQTD